MGYSLHQEITVEITVRVNGQHPTNPDPATTTSWTVHAGADNRTGDVAGFTTAVAAALEDARDQAMRHTTAHGQLLVDRGAHPGDYHPGNMR